MLKIKTYFILLQNDAQYVLEEELEISNSSIGTIYFAVLISFDNLVVVSQISVSGLNGINLVSIV